VRALALALVLASCATPHQAVATSGQVLLETGRQYEAVGGSMYRGCSQGRIPVATCSSWAAFAARFRPAYRAAVAAWSAGASATSSDWHALVGELADFGVALVAVAGADEGAR